MSRTINASRVALCLAAVLAAPMLSLAAYAAPSPTQKCTAAFESALGKAALCRLKADASFAKSLDATVHDAALTKCSNTLTKALGKALTKYPDACPAASTPSEFDAYLAACTDGAESASDGGGALPAVVPSCPGSAVAVGGACWLLGDAGQSCDDVCAGAGLVYDPATATYAGAALTQCGAVLNVLSVQTGIPISPLDDFACGDAIGGVGCGQDANTVTSHGTRCTTPATTSSASFAGARRACACKS